MTNSFHHAQSAAADSGFVEVKSKFDAEFRRFSLDRSKHQGCDKSVMS